MIDFIHSRNESYLQQLFRLLGGTAVGFINTTLCVYKRHRLSGSTISSTIGMINP